MSPFQAAIESTKEIGLAVLATTLSLFAVFLPVGCMGGIVGRFMSSFGLTAKLTNEQTKDLKQKRAEGVLIKILMQH